MVELSETAREIWAKFVNDHNEAIQALEGPDRAAGAKLEAYAARFALILHCASNAAGETDGGYIEVGDIEAGIALAKWFGLETRRVYRLMHESSEHRARRELLEWIASKGGRVTSRDLQRNFRRYQADPDAADVMLADLADRGYGSLDWTPPGEKGGRPTQIFCLADSPDFPINHANGYDKTPADNGQSRVLSASARLRGEK